MQDGGSNLRDRPSGCTTPAAGGGSGVGWDGCVRCCFVFLGVTEGSDTGAAPPAERVCSAGGFAAISAFGGTGSPVRRQE